jgi:hypothetical protein
LANGFDAVDELYAGDQLWQLAVAVETAPAFLSGLCRAALGRSRNIDMVVSGARR